MGYRPALHPKELYFVCLYIYQRYPGLHGLVINVDNDKDDDGDDDKVFAWH